MHPEQSIGKKRSAWCAALIFTLAITAAVFACPQGTRAQTSAEEPSAAELTPGMNSRADAARIARINAWTVGLAAGQLEGAPIRFATDIARVVDEGDKLHVLPIVTRGPSDNINALLYLKGVDLAIINSDSLEEFEKKIPTIRQRITYILRLFPSEVHVFVRPGINSLADLKGRKVNFNTHGTAAAYSGPRIFARLKVGEQDTFIPHQVALAQMRSGTGDIAAVVFVTSKPVNAFLRGKWPAGFKFLPVPFQDFNLYLPATLTSKDYPDLIPPGQEIHTIAVPTILAAYNWPPGSNRYHRVARLVDRLFTRLPVLQGPGFHPKWKDVVLNADVPGLQRFPAAQEWLDRTKPVAADTSQVVAAHPDGVPAGSIVLSPDNARLYREFLNWRRQQGEH